VRGYLIRSIKSSLTGEKELPRFNDWKDMFLDGIKFLIVNFVYMFPLIIAQFYVLLSDLATGLNAATISQVFGLGIWSLIVVVYVFIMIPFQLMAIANMANGGNLGAAFRFREILDKISIIGGGKFIAWYIINLIVIFVLSIIVGIIVGFSLSFSLVIDQIFIMLIFGPYILLYVARSTALIYK
jgi:hypothetical protein